MQYGVRPLPEVTKNLLIINVLMFFIQLSFPKIIDPLLSLYPFLSDAFEPYQLVSHMFMHGSPTHIFFNMFALYMFGRDLEYAMGAKRFLIFYLVAGFGAAFLHQGVGYAEIQYYLQGLDPAQINMVYDRSFGELIGFYEQGIIPGSMVDAKILMNIPAVGASGAIFGLLAGFGILYPNRMIMLLIPPIPMKAKYFVLVFGALELYLGFSGVQTGVAHFAHIGGALFGALLILIWRKRGVRF